MSHSVSINVTKWSKCNMTDYEIAIAAMIKVAHNFWPIIALIVAYPVIEKYWNIR